MESQTATPQLRRRGPAGLPHRLRPSRAGAALLALLAAAGASAGLLVSGAFSARAAITTAPPAAFKSALETQLQAQGARFQWVACIRNGRHFEGVAVVRCNVEFGEPHVEAYCAVFRGGRLLTSEDDPAIPCTPDDAGFSAPIHTYD